MATYRITYEERTVKTIDLEAASYGAAEAIFDDGVDLDGNQETDHSCRRLSCDVVLSSEVGDEMCRCGHGLAAHHAESGDSRCLAFTSDTNRQFDDGKDRSGQPSPCECLQFRSVDR